MRRTHSRQHPCSTLPCLHLTTHLILAYCTCPRRVWRANGVIFAETQAVAGEKKGRTHANERCLGYRDRDLCNLFRCSQSDSCRTNPWGLQGFVRCMQHCAALGETLTRHVLMLIHRPVLPNHATSFVCKAAALSRSRIAECIMTAELHRPLRRLLHVAMMRISTNPCCATVSPATLRRCVSVSATLTSSHPDVVGG